MMIRKYILVASVITLAVWAVAAVATELIGLPGSAATYPTETTISINGQPVAVKLTGLAMRKKLLFNVYAIGSYVEKTSTVKTAEELAAADTPKMLHLIMERDLDGKELAQAFQEAIRLNYAAPTFDQEITKLGDVLKAQSIKKGDKMQLIHVPGVGVECVLNGKTEVTINNVAFAKAVWEIYLGPKNLGPEIKAGLVFRL